MTVANKALVVFFIILNIVFVLNFGYTGTSRRCAVIVKMFSFIQVMCIAILFWLYIYILAVGIWPLWLIIGWGSLIINAVILASFSDRYSYYKLFKEFRDIDMILGSDIGCKVNIKIILFTLMAMLYRVALDSLICTMKAFPCASTAVGLYFKYNYMCFYATMVINFFVFYSAYCRLKILNYLVKRGYCHGIECLNLYKRIHDMVSKIMTVFQYLYLFALVEKILDTLMLLYLILSYICQNYEMNGGLIIKIINTTSNFCMMILPTVSAGLLKSEAEKLQENIQNSILKEKGREQEFQFQLFAEYVAARQMRFKIFRIVDLDWTMALLILNLCIYYQIIITQFTHLF